MECIDFDNITNLNIKLDDNFDFKNTEQIINLLNGKKNITLISTPTILRRIDTKGKLLVPTRVKIRNASELSIEEMSLHQCISIVQIEDGENTEAEQRNPYTRNEYENIRKKIDNILSQVEFPEENEPNREKNIFAQIYRILGNKISYDYNAISDSEKANERLQITCRNLLGGLLENRSVCAGYADILRNTLACADIYSEYVGAMPDIENGVSFNLKDPKGHAYNLVMLDGEKYWVDLTWDAAAIKADRYPLQYCLKSTKDFAHYTFKKRLQDEITDPCLKSLPVDEQIRIFTGKNVKNKLDNQKQEDNAIGYLSNCVMSIASSGVRADKIRVAANEISNCISVQVIEKEMEIR